jgi:ketosteroid isomerase-like protein
MRTFSARWAVATLAIAYTTAAHASPPVKMPPAIGAAYGRLGKAIQARDAEGVKAVWSDDFVVNAPNNAILRRDDVIAAMGDDLLAYKDFEKHIEYVGQHGDATIVMGHDTMVPLKGLGAGKHVLRPFTDVWMKDTHGWKLIARQATIADVED